MAPEVVGEGVGGDAGDADFVEEVGGSAGPGGLVFRRAAMESRIGVVGVSFRASTMDVGVIGESRRRPNGRRRRGAAWSARRVEAKLARAALVASQRAASISGRTDSNSVQRSDSVRRVEEVSGARRTVMVRAAKASSGFQPAAVVMRMGRWSSRGSGSRASPFS